MQSINNLNNNIEQFEANKLPGQYKVIDSAIQNHKCLKTYVIDDYDTLERDDAISLEELNDKYILWIHITSPNEHIELSSSVDREARLKASTIYYVNKPDYMYPKDIINLLSLEQGQDRITLSIGVSFDRNYNIIDFSVKRSLINPDFILSYSDVDDLLDYRPKEEEELFIIYNFLNHVRNKRFNNGAIHIDEPEGVFYYRDNIPYHKIKFPSPSKALVSEAMILYGGIMATYCKNNSVIVPYRCQQVVDIKRINSNTSNTNSHYQNHLLKQSLNKSFISVEALPHFSLGLECYLQCTSPLRRYLDVIAQYQILKHLDGQAKLNINDINQHISNFNIRFNENIQKYRVDKLLAINTWFQQNNSCSWKCRFLRFLNKKENICILYFIDLELDILCKLVDSELISNNYLVEVRYISQEPKSGLLVFACLNK